MQISDLLHKSKAEYGASYEEHCKEIYKLYVEMADRISACRQTANSLFLSISTSVSATVSYVSLGAKCHTAHLLDRWDGHKT